MKITYTADLDIENIDDDLWKEIVDYVLNETSLSIYPDGIHIYHPCAEWTANYISIEGMIDDFVSNGGKNKKYLIEMKDTLLRGVEKIDNRIKQLRSGKK